MSTSGRATYSPELMEREHEIALLGALQRLFEKHDLRDIWPAAKEASEKGCPIPLKNVEIVVLPLDRIGAPAGFSGAKVYVAYFRHRTEGADQRRPSVPVVVKIGNADELAKEIDGKEQWPFLAPIEEAKFAFPIKVDKEHPEFGVLIAPFKSDVRLEEDGSRNVIEVRDLWRLLEDKDETIPAHDVKWGDIRRFVSEALDAVEPVHACGMAKTPREVITYADDYERYLRKTSLGKKARPIVEGLFGREPKIKAFGEEWPNPTIVIDQIVERKLSFEGCKGAVHGDLHPKNIVRSPQEQVQIIDFGWAIKPRHVVVDYVLLDLNLRGTTLPSQISEADITALAKYLNPSDELDSSHPSIQERAKIIKEVIWKKAESRAVVNWDREYLIPLFLVGYGLLVHLDSARNQFALKATVLHLSRHINELLAGSATT